MNTDHVRRYRAMVSWGIILEAVALVVSLVLPRLGTTFGVADTDLLHSAQAVGIYVTLVLSIIGAILAALGAILFVRARRSQSRASSSTIQSPTGVGSVEVELQKLTDMRARNVIDDAEYQRLRENVINRR